MKRGQHRGGDVPANRCCQETNRIVIASNHDLGASRWRAAGLAAARKDLDNNHAAAAARAWPAMIGGEIRIGCVLCCRRLDVRHWGGHQLLGGCDETLLVERGAGSA